MKDEDLRERERKREKEKRNCPLITCSSSSFLILRPLLPNTDSSVIRLSLLVTVSSLFLSVPFLSLPSYFFLSLPISFLSSVQNYWFYRIGFTLQLSLLLINHPLEPSCFVTWMKRNPLSFFFFLSSSFSSGENEKTLSNSLCEPFLSLSLGKEERKEKDFLTDFTLIYTPQYKSCPFSILSLFFSGSHSLSLSFSSLSLSRSLFSRNIIFIISIIITW